MDRRCCAVFDASRGSLGTPFNATGSRLRATLDPMCACCHAFFDTARGGLRATLYGLLHLDNSRRWRVRSRLS